MHPFPVSVGCPALHWFHKSEFTFVQLLPGRSACSVETLPHCYYSCLFQHHFKWWNRLQTVTFLSYTVYSLWSIFICYPHHKCDITSFFGDVPLWFSLVNRVLWRYLIPNILLPNFHLSCIIIRTKNACMCECRACKVHNEYIVWLDVLEGHSTWSWRQTHWCVIAGVANIMDHGCIQFKFTSSSVLVMCILVRLHGCDLPDLLG